MEVIGTITQIIENIFRDLRTWDGDVKPWFRGESDDIKHPNGLRSLCPKIAEYELYHENYVLQSFRRQAGGLADIPLREDVDLWLFLAQHYGVPTRLLDWTEGALHALYFAINNKNNVNPRVYMLNPHKLNRLAGFKPNPLNYPLSHDVPYSTLYISLAWSNRLKDQLIKGNSVVINLNPHVVEIVKELRDIGDEDANIMADKLLEFASKRDPVARTLPVDLEIPIAFPATYQDQRMIAQRSCFTIHGTKLESLIDILGEKKIELKECLFEYPIDITKRDNLLTDLNVLGISEASIFPDLDHLAKDLKAEIHRDLKRRKPDADK